MKAIKTKFPCHRCGEPCQVARLADGPSAKCSRCRERDRLLRVAAFKDGFANDHAKKSQSCRSELENLLEWARAASERAQAAVCYLESVQHALRKERALLLRYARSRSEWARQVLGGIEPLFRLATKEVAGLEGFNGGGERSAPRAVLELAPKLEPLDDVRISGPSDEYDAREDK